MAATVDQANLLAGGGQALSGGSSAAANTNANVATGGLIVVLYQTFTGGSAAAAHQCSGGSLSWSVIATGASGSIRASLIVALAPAGLVSATAITPAVVAGGSHDHTWVMGSLLGVTSVTPNAFNNTAASTAAFSSGTLSGSGVGDLILGGATSDGSLLTGTPSGDNVEGIEFSSATTSGSVYLVYDLNGETNDTATGTWSGAQAHIAVGGAFPTSAAAAAVTGPTFTAIPFMGGH